MTARAPAILHRLRIACITGWLVLLGPALASVAAAAPDEGYSLGVLPYLVPRNMAALYGPAALDMSRQLGTPVKLRTSRSFDRFHDNLRNQAYDVAVVQPFDYGFAVQEAGYLPLVQVDQQLRAVVVVRAGDDYQSMADLKGRRIAMAPRGAATSRQGRWALADAGLKIGKDVTVEYHTTHDACLHELLVEVAAACVTGPPPLEDFVARTGAKFRVLAQTPPIPHMLAVVNPRVAEQDRQRLAAIMMGWRDTASGQELLRSMRFPGWVPVDAPAYEALQARIAAETPHHESRGDSSQLVFGSFPYLQPKVLAAKLAPIVQGFSRVAGDTVHFRTTPSYDRFARNLAEGLYDIVLVRPFSYDAAERAGYLPLARIKPALAASFYVQENSPLRHLEDLRGKVVATPPAPAVLSLIGMRHLQQNGLTPGRDLTVDHRRGHDSCLRQLVSGTADSCITSPIVIHSMAEQIPGRFRVLTTTPAVPNILFMVHERHPPALRQRLRELILGWNDSTEGQQIYRSSALGPFSLVDPESYRGLTSE